MENINHKNSQKKMKSKKNEILPVKEFKARNSLLTDLYEIDHFKSIYRIFISVFITLVINNTVADLLGTGGFSMSNVYRIIVVGFGQFHKAAGIWLLMVGCTLSIYPLFCLWAYVRRHLQPASFLLKIWDRLWFAGFIVYYGLFLYIPPSIKGFEMPIVSSAVVLAEQVRLLMKTHAFVRSNASAVLSYKVHSEQKSPVPSFSKYMYFLVIPTLIYRDEYPRTKSIRWWFVAMNFTELVVAIVFLSFLTANYLEPEFKNYCLVPFTWRTITTSVFRTILPASQFMVIGNYILLHSWMNAWAEMTRFADRMFYADWWNEDSYSAYYRKWNVVVHDFLHVYIYRDVFEKLKNKFAATMIVFCVSAVVHEYIVTAMLGFFYPVLFVQFFGLGALFVFIKVRNKPYIGNTFLWWSLTCGLGIQICLYGIEWYARINCPKEAEDFTDFFIPRTWTCIVPASNETLTNL